MLNTQDFDLEQTTFRPCVQLNHAKQIELGFIRPLLNRD